MWPHCENQCLNYDYSIVLVSPLARNILDDLQTLVAQLESDLVEEKPSDRWSCEDGKCGGEANNFDQDQRGECLLVMFQSHLDRGLLLFLACQVSGGIVLVTISSLFLSFFFCICVCLVSNILFVSISSSSITWRLAKCTPPLEVPLTLLLQGTTHSRSSFAPLPPFEISNWSRHWCHWRNQEKSQYM